MGDINSVTQLLSQVKTISDAYEIVAKNTGENFNIFSILGMESAEVKTHSKIIAELLDPKGSHQQGDVFLKLFLQCIDFDCEKLIRDFNTEKAIIIVEKHIGKVTDTDGGRIDIHIADNANCILIENKIYAGEQANQILRYSNYGKGNYNNSVVLFLTRFGEDSKTATKDVKYIPISYEKDIVNWLELCKKEAVNLPILREAIGQYCNLIKKLTFQTENKNMEKKLQQLILENEQNFETAKLIKNTLQSVENTYYYRLNKIVEIGNRHKSEIDMMIKKFFPDSYLMVLKPFNYCGVRMCRIDIVMKEENGKREVIAIQPEIINYKIHNAVWVNDPIIYSLIKNNLPELDFNYDFESTPEEIMENIKNQIEKILSFITEKK